MLVFEEGEKTGVPGEKTLGARTRTNNKLNLHITLSNNDIFELKGIQFDKVKGSIFYQNKVS